jgi:hypothetical protein
MPLWCAQGQPYHYLTKFLLVHCVPFITVLSTTAVKWCSSECRFLCNTDAVQGWDSSVGIATRYELDGSGIESRGGEIFSTSLINISNALLLLTCIFLEQMQGNTTEHDTHHATVLACMESYLVMCSIMLAQLCLTLECLVAHPALQGWTHRTMGQDVQF